MAGLKTLLLASLAMVSAARAVEIKHRFLAKDESRPGVHYVDQFDPSNDWDIKLPRGCRDIRLVDGDRLLISHPDGYLEYDLTTQNLIKKTVVKEGALIQSLERLPNGHTILGGGKKFTTFYELDENDQLLREVSFERYGQLRLMRLSPEGHFLFGANLDQVIEADWSGNVYQDFAVPLKGVKRVYWVKKMEGGKVYRVVTGYGHAIVDMTPDGKILRQMGGDGDYHCFSRPYERANGNIVVGNWTGHKSTDSEKGVQLVEFDPQGNVVWKWHDPMRAGTIHGVIILD